MRRTATHRPIVEVTADGSLEQIGHTSEVSAESTSTFEAVAESAGRLRKLYAEQGLDIGKSPSLVGLLEDAERLASVAEDERTMYQLFSALQVKRLSEAVLALEGNAQIRLKLAETLDGPVSFLSRKRSKAKDTLWELELHRVLAECGMESEFAEPDLMLALAGTGAGVACKKLYSEANVEKVLSQGIRQVEKASGTGIVALDIEDLLPENAILQVPDSEAMVRRLNEHNDGFMRRHERHLRKYLEPGRAISVVVSCSAIVDIVSRSPRFYTARQTTMWNIPNQYSTQSSQVKAILSALLSSHAA